MSFDALKGGFLDIPQLSIVGDSVEAVIRYIMLNWKGALYDIRSIMAWALLNLENFLSWLPWWMFILIIFVSGVKLVSWKAAIAFTLMLFLIGWMGYWESMIYTLSIVIAAIVIAITLGMFTGIALSQSPLAERLLRPFLDAMQTTPSMVYLLPVVMLFGLGKVPALLSTMISILPPVIRLTCLGIKQVSPVTIAAADAFGCTSLQKLFKVQLPQALPIIAAGVNQTTLMALGMVVVTSMIGAKGLGLDILTAITFLNVADAVEAGISVIFVAIILDRLTQGIANKFKRQ